MTSSSVGLLSGVVGKDPATLLCILPSGELDEAQQQAVQALRDAIRAFDRDCVLAVENNGLVAQPV